MVESDGLERVSVDSFVETLEGEVTEESAWKVRFKVIESTEKI